MKPLLIFTPLLLIVIISNSIHMIDEGHVGVYWRGGALLDRVTYPGWHFKLPFVDSYDQVQVTLQTDKVTHIPCGTSGGVMLTIDRVEVVNRLNEKLVYQTIKNYTVNYDKIWIFDKIHHEINQFCSKHTLQEVYIDLFHTVDERLQAALQEACDKWAPGIEIVAIRITKPRIPDHILRNYEAMEAEKTKLLVSIEAQKVTEKEAETEKKRATIEAEKIAAVAKIKMDQQIMEKESQKKIKFLEDEATLHHQKTLADAEFYTALKQAESNKLLFSPEFLQAEMIRAVGNTTKVYFGPSIQSMFVEFMDLALNKQISSNNSSQPPTTKSK